MPHKLPYKQYLEEKLRRHVARQFTRLYPENAERADAATEAVLAGNSKQQALIWMGDPPAQRPFTVQSPALWQPSWLDVLSDIRARPGAHPLHDEGAYYLFDVSSAVVASVVLTRTAATNDVLDMCASPGGKAVYTWRAHHPSTLVANEVLAPRHRALRSNLTRCRVPAQVTKLDASLVAQQYPDGFDLILVDAPCSGQSLVARGIEAPGAYQDFRITQDVGRQRRILANMQSCTKQGGWIVYSTCTYSREENEGNLQWFLRRFPEYRPVEVPHLSSFQSTVSDVPCYRIEPHMGAGAGGFVAVLEKQ